MANNDLNKTINNLKTALKYPELFENLSSSERMLSGAAGTYMLIKSASKIFKHPLMGLAGLGLGAGLIYRGLTGYCPVKDATDPNHKEVVITETYTVE